jgi:hypothetical protein
LKASDAFLYHDRKKPNLNSMKALTQLNAIPLALIIAGSLSVLPLSSQAQNTLTADATLSDVQVGSLFDYTLTLHNTGSVVINSFWYGWIQGVFNLPTAGTNLQNVQNSMNWDATDSGNSIQFENNSGTALAIGSSMTFTFESTEIPSSFITDSSDRPVASIAYAAANGPSTFGQSQNGIASDPISTTLTATPEPSSIGLFVAGGFGLALFGWQKSRKPAVETAVIKK